jgi:hypothetical protein
LKGIFPANRNFQGGVRVKFLQIGLFSSVEEKHAPLERKASVFVVAASSTFFPCKN